MYLFNIIASFAGGIGLFLFGMKLMSEGLSAMFSSKMKTFFNKVTRNPIKSILIGIIVTVIVQSSSTSTVMIIGFVNTGLIDLSQAARIILGANIGTTITGQIIALNIDEYMYIFIALGVLLIIFSKKDKIREMGRLILGFGMVFIGMEFLENAIIELSKSQILVDMIISLKDRTFTCILLGIIITATIQNSLVSIGIFITLSGIGILPLEAAIPIVFGSNIGTTITALISSIGTVKDARRAALIHLLFNLIGTLLFIPLIPVLEYVVTLITPLDIKRQIANTHTIFNITNVLIMMPLMKYIILFSKKIIRGENEYDGIGLKYIDERIIQSPIVSVGQVTREVIRMGEKVEENLRLAIEAFKTENEDKLKLIYNNEKFINLLQKDITTFLVKLHNIEMSEEEKNKVTMMFYLVDDIERIGDHCKYIADLTIEKIYNKLEYSHEGIKEIEHIYSYTLNALQHSIISFKENDIKKAEHTLILEENIDRLEKEYRKRYINRLNNGMANSYSGMIFLDILSNMERIGDHAVNIAGYVIRQS